jgi:hypothetical protein
MKERIALLEEDLEIAKDTRAMVDEALRERRVQVETQQQRITLLEAELSQSMGDHVDTGRALRLARAENQRLREAAEQVVFECEADDDAMMPSVAAVFKLRALLQEDKPHE